MIPKAVINGKEVYALLGEKIRGEDLRCIYCNAKLHLQRFPEREDYYFALNPGEKHTSICQYYENKRMPVLKGCTPESFITKLCTPSKEKCGGGNGGGNGGQVGGGPGLQQNLMSKMTSLNQMIKAGIYYENPFAPCFHKSKYRFIDFVILDKWAKYVWEKRDFCNIGLRIVDARWIGSFSGAENIAVADIKKNRRIWFQMFWKIEGTYRSVRFCLDVDECFKPIVKQLFVSKVRANGTFNEFSPKYEKMDLLIAANWGRLNKEQCREMCPIKKCEGCLGAYWGKARTDKQIEFFTTNDFTKNKESGVSKDKGSSC